MSTAVQSPPDRRAVTISICPVKYEDGSFGAELHITGLTSQAHADAACEHMTRLFCGDEIKVQG